MHNIYLYYKEKKDNMKKSATCGNCPTNNDRIDDNKLKYSSSSIFVVPAEAMCVSLK